MRLVVAIFAGVVAGACLYVGATLLADSIGVEKAGTLLVAMCFGGFLGLAAAEFPR